MLHESIWRVSGGTLGIETGDEINDSAAEGVGNSAEVGIWSPKLEREANAQSVTE